MIELDFNMDNTLPVNIARSPQGKIYFANGLDPIRRWNGIGFTTETAGMDVPTGAPTITGSGSGSLTGTYTGYYRWKDGEGNYSNFSDVSAEITVASVAQIDWAVPADPAPARATHIQLFRNTSGGTKTYYLDGEVQVGTGTAKTYTSTLDDNTLALQQTQPVNFPDGQTAAFRYTPPKAKRSLAWHRERMHYTGDVIYKTGHVEVTRGSTTVTGIGTRFTQAMVGRNFYIEGTNPITIASVASGTSLTLAGDPGVTNTLQRYQIQASETELSTTYWSYVNEAESVAETQSFVVDEDDDRLTGNMIMGSMLYLQKKHKTMRFPTQRDPFTDGSIFPAMERGVVNPRCWARIEGGGFYLDREGIYKWTGNQPEHISTPIQDLFRDGGINWRMSEWFHAVVLPYERVVRFFVAVEGSGLPQHALCYQYETGAWWIERYPFAVGSSCRIEINGHERMVLGTSGFRAMVYGDSNLDGPTGFGATAGVVASATPLSITHTASGFPSNGVVGSPLCITRGLGKGQTRTITEVDTSTGKITVKNPWQIIPDTTSYFQIGGIQCEWKSPLYQEASTGERTRQRVRFNFKPTDEANHINCRVVHNMTRVPDTQWVTELEDTGMRRWEDDSEWVELVVSKDVSGVGIHSDLADDNEGYNDFTIGGNSAPGGLRAYVWDGFDFEWVTTPSGLDIYTIGIDGVL